MIRLVRRHTPFVAVLAAFAVASALAACGKDSTPTTPTTNLTGNTLIVDSASAAQSALVGSTITIGFRVANSTGTAGIPGQVVTVRPAVNNGTVADSTVTTDANGHAVARWTLGTVSGTNILVLSATGVTTNATATALALTATKLVRVSVDSQTIVASASTSLVVRSTDQFGNPVPNVVVSWTSNGGTITPTSTTTGSAGNAAITFTTTATPKTYSITATSPGLTPVTFTLTGS